jgi:hypothetical protein
MPECKHNDNDSSAGGITDILKRGDSDRQKLLGSLSNEEVVDFAGAVFKQTTTAPSVTIGGNCVAHFGYIGGILETENTEGRLN